ncbi:non-homologous end joining protein Ku [Kineosporia succinea]|uniref:Non-homologous end joining protein Ku n=1 Tax=Kineosporia succinea TaxID=84632 RepID=A0ABT9P2N1_9ACTN|nr:Ku protein [Kineosporia succinea]MDP9826649.1 DNA end-binding protein Ku [Kineosporia succinea]
MRAIWKGAVSFGLVNVPVRLFSATQEHDIRFHQVHREDGGRIRMKRICSACGEEVAWDQLAKGYEAEDGRLVVLTDEDFDQLPLSTGREIDVVEFVPTGQVDPILYGKAYYLEPDARAAKPYALLREALEATDRVAVVKVALRQRESLAVLRVRDRVIMMQTLMWPDEIRAAEFPVLEEDVDLRPQELRMAASLVDSMAADFEPDQYEDDYQQALVQLVEAKLEGAAPAPVEAAEEAQTEVVDLLSALQASVDRAKEARGEKPSSGGAARKSASSGTKKTAAKKSSSSTSASTTKKTAAKKTAAKKTPARKSA